MRKFGKKRLVAVMTAIAMATSMMGSMSAMAATLEIVPQNAERPIASNTVFSLYRILDVTTNGNNGYAYTLNQTYKDVVADALTAVGTQETDVIAYLGTYGNDSPEVREFADKLKEIIEASTLVADDTVTSSTGFSKEVTDGYYLILDNGAGYATSLCQLKTTAGTGTITISVKGDYPTVEKKVEEDDTYRLDEGYGEGYNDAADYSIGETVPFSFYSSVPNMTGYDADNPYKYVFHDEMSAGLTFDPQSVVVRINGAVVDGTDYQVIQNPANDRCTFEIQIADLTQLGTAGQSIQVSFNAALNENAVIGIVGNPNEVHLEYSSNPYDDSETKTTEKDKVVVFTFDTKINKVIKDTDTKLAGAKFRLYADATAEQEIKLVDLGNSVYRVDMDADATTAGAEIVSDGTNNMVIQGLDTGTYYLVETDAPAGYNQLAAPIQIDLVATYTDRQNWDGIETTTILTKLPNLDAGNNEIITTVENSTGSLLPETGGTGTMMLYVLGTALMAGGVFFLTAKGKKKEEQ